EKDLPGVAKIPQLGSPLIGGRQPPWPGRAPANSPLKPKPRCGGCLCRTDRRNILRRASVRRVTAFGQPTQLIIAPVASENSIRLGAWLEWAPRMRAAHDLLETAEFRGSPVPKVCATG